MTDGATMSADEPRPTALNWDELRCGLRSITADCNAVLTGCANKKQSLRKNAVFQP